MILKLVFLRNVFFKRLVYKLILIWAKVGYESWPMFLEYNLACGVFMHADQTSSFLPSESAEQAPFISVWMYLIYTVSTLLPGMEIANTSRLAGHEIKLPGRICVAPEGILMPATWLSAVVSLPL